MEQGLMIHGLLIVFEGISGSGKSEGINALIRELRVTNSEVLLYEWNSNSWIRNITKLLAKTRILGANSYSLLQWIGFVFDYLIIILPALKKKKIVVCDRYYFSGLTRDEVNGAFRWLGRWISKRVKQPDYIYYFDTPVKICYERIKARGKPLFHTNKKIARNPDVVNKELYYLEQMDLAYKRLIQPHLLDTNDIRSSDGKEFHYGMVAATGTVINENTLSDRYVWGCTERIKSMVD